MIKKFIKKILIALVPKHYLYFFSDLLVPKSFGQLGEDMVIHNHLSKFCLSPNELGSYIDIGCFHPSKGSNTFKFYRNGSSGLVIDVGKKKKRFWALVRPRDKFIDAAVVPLSYKDKKIKFLKQPGYGEETDHAHGGGILSGDHKLSIESEVINPAQITDICIKETNWFDASWRFINIDIEGLDEEVILDFDLKFLKPDVIAIEKFLPKDLPQTEKIQYHGTSNLTKKLTKRGYSLSSISGPTLIYMRVL